MVDEMGEQMAQKINEPQHNQNAKKRIYDDDNRSSKSGVGNWRTAVNIFYFNISF